MDDLTRPTPPPFFRVVPPPCPTCERSVARLEHLIQGDFITSSWICACGVTWPADGDLAPERPKDDTERSSEGFILRDLHELVAALDRRQSYSDADREHRVATMSATLRTQAVERIAHLEGAFDAPEQPIAAPVGRSVRS